MHAELSGKFFGLLGIFIGSAIGIAISALQPIAMTALGDFFLNVKVLLFILLSYLVIQLALGASLKRPIKSGVLHFGMLAIPVTYALFMNYPLGQPLDFYPIYFAVVALLFAIPIVYILAIGWILGHSIRFFMGYDRRLLTDGNLDPRAVSYYELEFTSSDKVDTELCEKIDGILGFSLLKKAEVEDCYHRAIYRWGTDCFGSSWKRLKIR